MEDEGVKLKIKEEIVLVKYDGEPPAEGEVKKPIETIRLVYENGKLISRSDEGVVDGTN